MIHHLILTPPNPEHIIAAGMVACAVSSPRRGPFSDVPALVQVVSPIHEMAAAIRAWLQEPDRPRCWVIAMDTMVLDELAADFGWVRGGTEARLREAGLFFFIGELERAVDPIARVYNHLDAADGLESFNARWRDLSRSARHRSVAVHRAIQAWVARGIDAGASPIDWRRQLALACSLTRNQGRQVRVAWDIGGPAWAEVLSSLGLGEEQWNIIFIEALTWLDGKAEEWVWQHQIVGFSAASRRLRDEARSAARSLAAGKSVLVVAHDRDEAARLAAVIAQVAAGGDGTAEPEAPLAVWWDGSTTPSGILLVDPAIEAEVYARSDVTIVDVPPLDERSMDLPHLALAELWRLHRTAARPGAPRAGCDRPEDLAWLCDRDLPDGTAGLRAWLSARLDGDPGGDWIRGDPSLPRHPGLDGTTCFSAGLTLDTATAQVVRWALGAHSEQAAALRRLGLGANRPPRCLVAADGMPRRLLRQKDGGWLDRWAAASTG